MKGRVVGTVKVPAMMSLSLSAGWRKAFGIPEPTADDWRRIIELRGTVVPQFGNGAKWASPTGDLILDLSRCLRMAREISLHSFLLDNMFQQAGAYAAEGVECFLLDFGEVWDAEPAEYWLARSMAEKFCASCDGKYSVGVKMGSDARAVDIACRFGMEFVMLADSCWYSEPSALRNRMTDGTQKRKPVIYMDVFDASGEFDRWGVEGCVLRIEDEDEMDSVGRKIDSIEQMTGVRIPTIGFWMDEVSRGEMKCDLEEWGARDSILIDGEARAVGSLLVVDDDRLKEAMENIRKLT